MGRIVVFMNLTLDGVMQAPGRREEDLRGGFRYGGWGASYVAMTEAGESTPNFGALLLGRQTYEQFYSYWPKQTNNPFTEALTKMSKYVASTTLKEPLAWSNSTLLKGDVAEAVAGLKSKLGKDVDIVVMGSGDLIQTLMQHNLVDRYVLLIHPLVLGSGRRLFTDGSPFAELHLISAKTTPKGVVVATYEPSQPMGKKAPTSP
jgi:dihydrofolate reductase